MQKFLTIIVIMVLTSGCALKSYSHLGISNYQGGQLAGVVSAESAKEFDNVVFKFHDLLKNEQYAEAYDFFYKDLKNQVSLEKFIEDQKNLNKDFGEEKKFVHLYYPQANILPKIDAALFQDAFVYYDYVNGAYKSVRAKDIVYEFSVLRVDDDFKIVGLTYGPCEEACR